MNTACFKVALCALAMSLSGCSGGKGGTTSPTTSAADGIPAGIEPGGRASVRAFEYQLKSGTLRPADDPGQQRLVLGFSYENISKASFGVGLPASALELDGDQNQAAQSTKAAPDGDVAPGGRGTYDVTFIVSKAFNPTSVAVVMGDARRVEAPLVPLGPGAKKDTKEAVAKAATTVVTPGKYGITLTIDGAKLQYVSPLENAQADIGTSFLLLHGSLKAGTSAGSLAAYDVTLREPNKTVVYPRSVVNEDKAVDSVEVAAGQTREVALLFGVSRANAAGTYVLDLRTFDDTPASGRFILG